MIKNKYCKLGLHGEDCQDYLSGLECVNCKNCTNYRELSRLPEVKDKVTYKTVHKYWNGRFEVTEEVNETGFIISKWESRKSYIIKNLANGLTTTVHINAITKIW